MGCNDMAALAVLEHCRSDHLRVPDDVAVLGVDNDDLIQSLAMPPLSSINTAAERVGFEAASLLDRLLAGEKVDDGPVRIAPVGVVTRLSSDVLATRDIDVREAVCFIRTHAGSPIGVEQVLASVSVSRRQLERRFRAVLAARCWTNCGVVESIAPDNC